MAVVIARRIFFARGDSGLRGITPPKSLPHIEERPNASAMLHRTERADERRNGMKAGRSTIASCRVSAARAF